MRHECDTSATRTTRVKTYFHTPICAIWKVKVYKERHSLILRTTFWKCLAPMPNAFEKCITKTKLFNGKRYMKKLYTRLQLHVDVLAHSRIVTHSKAASFTIKTILCENINILFSKNYWKLGKMNGRFSKNI